MAKQETVPGEVRWRQALHGGLMGAVGVVLAWVMWVVISALFDKWASVVIPPAVGALVGQWRRDFIFFVMAAVLLLVSVLAVRFQLFA